MKSRFVVAVMLALCGAAAVHAGVDLEAFGVGRTPPGTELFLTTGAPTAPDEDAGPGATIAWPVTVDVALLDTLPATLEVNFPDREAVTLTRMRGQHRGTHGFLWTGRGGDCSGLFRRAASGFKGLLSCVNAPYGVDHAPGSSTLRLSRYDAAGSPVHDEAPLAAPPAALPAAAKSCEPPTTTDTTVDVLVLFNANLTSFNIWQFARDVKDQIQLAMDNSTPAGQPNIAEVRLAGAAHISRHEDNKPSEDLLVLKDDPEANALRDYWAADAVIYITTGTGPQLGIAYIPGAQGNPLPGCAFAPFAYAVSLAGYATGPGEFVAAHELAHTFGANHNPDHQPVNPDPIEDWAFAHWAVQGGDLSRGSRTILSYKQECLALVSLCPPVLNYSNPNVTVAGWFQTGIANQRDNARLIAEIAPIEAQYRASLGRIFADGFE